MLTGDSSTIHVYDFLTDETTTIESGHLTYWFRRSFTVAQAAGVTDVVICGAMSQMCIDATARAAVDLGKIPNTVDGDPWVVLKVANGEIMIDRSASGASLAERLE